MAYRLFEGKDHAAVYQKDFLYCLSSYIQKGRPHVLAVDVGCGTGQNCRLMAPHFHNVVGIDISECQLEEAKAEPGHPNITYRRGAAEELPFADASVDLITAASAAHWFDQSRFLDEVSRVLKPRGCVALLGFCDDKTTFHFQDCGQRLNHIYEEVKQILLPYTSRQVAVAEHKLEELYAVIINNMSELQGGVCSGKSSITVKTLVGFMESWSHVPGLQEENPEMADELLKNTQNRYSHVHMTHYFCVLASKP
uniref:Zgc:162396 n=1 Tax=Sphaeramia orbicularis TaxID=375764 RepID=A0A673AAN5_9TELE